MRESALLGRKKPVSEKATSQELPRLLSEITSAHFQKMSGKETEGHLYRDASRKWFSIRISCRFEVPPANRAQ